MGKTCRLNQKIRSLEQQISRLRSQINKLSNQLKQTEAKKTELEKQQVGQMNLAQLKAANTLKQEIIGEYYQIILDWDEAYKDLTLRHQQACERLKKLERTEKIETKKQQNENAHRAEIERLRTALRIEKLKPNSLSLKEKVRIKQQQRLLGSIENLVFKGGGVKGLAYLGAIRVLLNTKNKEHLSLHQIKRVCGASAGAITALFLALGASFNELEQLINNLNLLDLLDKGKYEGIKHCQPDSYFNLKQTVQKLLEIYNATGANKVTFGELIAYFVRKYFVYKAGNIAYQFIANNRLIVLNAFLSLLKILSIVNPYMYRILIPIFIALNNKSVGNYILDGISDFIVRTSTGIDLNVVERKLKIFFKCNKHGLEGFVISTNRVLDKIIEDKGIFPGDAFLNWLGKKLEEFGFNKDITFHQFQELKNNSKFPRNTQLKDPYFVGVNLTTGLTEIFSHESTPRMRMIDAVRISMSIPGFFMPYKLPNSKALYTDGGVLDNYPIWVLDNSRYIGRKGVEEFSMYNPLTLGFNLVPEEQQQLFEQNKKGVDPKAAKHDAGIMKYIMALLLTINGMGNTQRNEHFRSGSQFRTVYINTGHVSTVDFALSNADRAFLDAQGERGSLNFLERLERNRAMLALQLQIVEFLRGGSPGGGTPPGGGGRKSPGGGLSGSYYFGGPGVDASGVVNPGVPNSLIEELSWYRDDDIDTLLKTAIKRNLGGYATEAGCDASYLLRGHQRTNDFLDQQSGNRYVVAVTPAIASNAPSYDIAFFLDKDKQGQADSAYARNNSRDVFCELMPVLLKKKNCYAKILFPYNVTHEAHWLTGEIKIQKIGNRYLVETTAHDPYGGGFINKKHAAELSKAIKKGIRRHHSNSIVQVQNARSCYDSRRQAEQDANACGVITCKEMVKRIRGESLDRNEPYEYGALSLRREHIKQVIAHYPVSDPDRRHFLERNKLEVVARYNLRKQKQSLKHTFTRNQPRGSFADATTTRSTGTFKNNPWVTGKLGGATVKSATKKPKETPKHRNAGLFQKKLKTVKTVDMRKKSPNAPVQSKPGSVRNLASMFNGLSDMTSTSEVNRSFGR